MKYKSGDINALIIVIIAMGMVLLGLGGLSMYLYTESAKSAAAKDSDIAAAVADAERNQKEKDDTYWMDINLNDKEEFSGPDDYGHLTFKYPKSWDLYIAGSGSNKSIYSAYFHEGYVPAISDTEKYALIVRIYSQTYDSVVASYAKEVAKATITSTPLNLPQVGNAIGTRYDGYMTKTIRGSRAIFKIRNSTIEIRTDSAEASYQKTFKEIIDTLKYNP